MHWIPFLSSSMTESCSRAAVAGEQDVLRLELAEAAASGSGAAHLSTSEVAPDAVVEEATAAAASARRPRMKSLSEELEPHFEEPDEALSDGEGIANLSFSSWDSYDGCHA